MSSPAPRPVPTEADRARLAARYPKQRLPRPVLITLVVVGALVGGWWLVWAALFHANPAVSAQVSAYTVRSDTSIAVTLTVDRPDPSVVVSCRVRAQAVDFQSVGEQLVRVEATPYRVADVTLEITTLRRATSASVGECSVI